MLTEFNMDRTTHLTAQFPMKSATVGAIPSMTIDSPADVDATVRLRLSARRSSLVHL
jgi:hypothetical protein